MNDLRAELQSALNLLQVLYNQQPLSRELRTRVARRARSIRQVLEAHPVTDCSHAPRMLTYVCEWPEFGGDKPSMHNCSPEAGGCGTTVMRAAPVGNQERIPMEQHLATRNDAAAAS